MSKKVLSALVLGAVLALSAPAQSASTNVFTGVNVAHNSWFAYVGGVTALSGQDILTQAGWLARLGLGYGSYDYSRTLLSDVNGDVWDGDLMIGYGAPFSGGRISAYIGGDWQNHNLDRVDLNNSVQGSRGGVKGQLELNFNPVNNIGGNAVVTYSTAFRTYWTRGDVHYNFGSFSLGPEIGFQGNEEYSQFRYGATVGAIDLGFASAALHGGWMNSSRANGDGAYGEIGFAKNF